ncbi:MAG: hypothetical protein PHN72_06395 [Bacilli bacterium]|nr:hypothetical protein [Bacilli bacterium]
MPSRMERYQNEDIVEGRRTKKNQNLYRNIDQEGEYSNIEGVASLSKGNEINLDKLKEMLQKREEINERKYRTATIPVIKRETLAEASEDSYDIKEMIDKAKIENPTQNKHRSLKSVDYDFLKSLQLRDLRSLKEDPDASDELKDLINTITSTSVLNQLGDKELSLDMLSELKPTGNTKALGNSESLALKNLLAEDSSKKQMTRELDQTFFTTSHNFKAEDFESLEDVKTSIKKTNTLLKIFMYVLGFLVVLVLVYFIIKLWK